MVRVHQTSFTTAEAEGHPADTSIAVYTIAAFVTVCRLVIRIKDRKWGLDDFWALFAMITGGIMLTGALIIVTPPRTFPSTAAFYKVLSPAPANIAQITKVVGYYLYVSLT